MEPEIAAALIGVGVLVVIQIGVVAFGAGKIIQAFKDLEAKVNELPCRWKKGSKCPEGSDNCDEE